MVKIENLMVGDWINWWHPRKQSYVPMQVKREHFSVGFSENEVQPIQLTKEMFGQYFHEYEEGYTIGWWDNLNGTFHVEFSNDKCEISMDIRYFHELQHMLGICGLGKEIKPM